MFDLERNGVWNAIGPSGVKFFFICYNNYSLLVAVLFWFSVMISRNTEFKSWSSKAKFIIRGLLKLEGCFMWYTHDSDISNSNNGPLLSMHIKLIEFLKEILTISTSVTTLHKVKLFSVTKFQKLITFVPELSGIYFFFKLKQNIWRIQLEQWESWARLSRWLKGRFTDFFSWKFNFITWHGSKKKFIAIFEKNRSKQVTISVF